MRIFTCVWFPNPLLTSHALLSYKYHAYKKYTTQDYSFMDTDGDSVYSSSLFSPDYSGIL